MIPQRIEIEVNYEKNHFVCAGDGIDGLRREYVLGKFEQLFLVQFNLSHQQRCCDRQRRSGFRQRSVIFRNENSAGTKIVELMKKETDRSLFSMPQKFHER